MTIILKFPDSDKMHDFVDNYQDRSWTTVSTKNDPPVLTIEANEFQDYKREAAKEFGAVFLTPLNNFTNTNQFSMKNQTLDALRQSLINLSNASGVHMPICAAELSNTRLAILKLEDVDIEELLNHEKAYALMNALNSEISDLTIRSSELSVEIAKGKSHLYSLMVKIAELESRLAARGEVVEELKSDDTAI